ncbi:MAG: sugar phosphate nucleotidyltransferase [Candidatus Hermodarchaeota archaeon]
MTKVIILAGGEGTRLRPYTYVLPKPLMPIGDIPILEIILNQLRHYGFKDVIFALNQKAKLISTFFGLGEELGLNISYSYEDRNLGTAGPLTLIKNLDENFLVMNGDILTDLDYKKFMKVHVKNEAAVTIASYPKTIKINLGVVETDDKNRVVEYIEKPRMIYQVSMGIYAYNKRVIKYIPYNEYFDFPDLIKKLISEGENVQIYKPPLECIWLDIGRVKDFQQSLKVFEANKEKFLHL